MFTTTAISMYSLELHQDDYTFKNIKQQNINFQNNIFKNIHNIRHIKNN